MPKWSALLIGFALSFLGTKGRADQPIRGQYVVTEIELLSEPRKKFRIAKVYFNESVRLPAKTLRFSVDRPLASRFTPQGFGDDGNGLDLEKARPGDTKVIEAPSLRLMSIFGFEESFEGPLKYRVTLLKSCSITARPVSTKTIESSGNGMIQLPKLVPISYTEISEPSCLERTDRLFDLIPPEERRSSTEEKDWQIAETTNSRLLKARSACSNFKPDLERSFESDLRRLNCPDVGAYSTELGISSFEFGAGTMTVLFQDGRVDSFTSVNGLDKTFGHIKSLKTNRCCFTIVRGNVTGSESDVVSEINLGLKPFLRQMVQDRVTNELKK